MNFSLQIYFQNLIERTLWHERIAGLFVVLFVMIVFAPTTFAQKGSKIRTVVIDPGHGGRDPGAVGKRSKEKDIVLDVALKTGAFIKQNLPDVKVIYTRTKDEFIELHRRAAIANENQADVFISIHCNAAKDKSVFGAETFVMGEHRTQANLEVAKLENAAVLFEENVSEVYGGFDPNSTAAYITLSLFQSENQAQSINIAQKVQEQFSTRLGRKDRSVQQAGFLVLYKTALPSILVELGFITNPQEEEFLMSEEGKTYLASAIYRAFRDYKKQFERNNSTALKLPAEWEQVLAPTTDSNAADISISETKPSAKPVNPEIESKPKPNGSTSVSVDKPAISYQTNAPSSASRTSGVLFKVQFETLPREIPITDKRFSQIQTVDMYFHNGLYKYTSGSFNSFNQAVAHQSKMRKAGFADAFVIAFNNGNRITIDEAHKLQKRK